MSVFYLPTKLYIPSRRENAIQRPRLVETILAGTQRAGALTLLSGPAGFGKTTLLGEMAYHLKAHAAWVSLDEGDNDPSRFWTYLIKACQSVQNLIGEAALASMQMPQSLPDEAIPAMLIEDISKMENRIVLILDDYHVIQNNAIHTALFFLFGHAPEKLHLVISTRSDPPWPLARLRARNQLVEVRVQDLRFTTQEATVFLNQLMGLSLREVDVEALEERTEGWAAGLQLAALSMKGRTDVSGFVKNFTGSHIYIAEYLMEEVLQSQPKDVKTFLLLTSILERLSSGLCEAVTGMRDGQSMLMKLEKENLFVVPLDIEGRWFRYHHLFADLLKARLQQEHSANFVASLHQRASIWFEKKEMIPEAIEHALMGKDYSGATKWIEKTALPVILQAHVKTVEDWLQAIPKEMIENSPRIYMAYAWMHLLRGTIDGAFPYLDRLAAFFSSGDIHEGDFSLWGEWMTLQGRLLNMQGKPADSIDLSKQALNMLPEEDIHVRSMALVNLAMSYQQVLEYDHAADAFQRIVQVAQMTGDYVSEILGLSGRAQMLLLQGRLQLVHEIVSEGIGRFEASGKITPFSATLYGELGQVHYHWHHLDQARTYSEKSAHISGRSGYSDPEIYRHIMNSRIFQMEGNQVAAADEMQRAGDLARMIPPSLIREDVISQQVRVDLACGRLAAALEMLKKEGFSFDSEFGYPDIHPDTAITTASGLLYNSALRALLFQPEARMFVENLKCGVELAGIILAGELRSQLMPVALETLLLRCQMHAALGDRQKSLADISQALVLAGPDGFISIFVEEGAVIGDSLKSLLDGDLTESESGYIWEILSAFPGTQCEIAGHDEMSIPIVQTHREGRSGNSEGLIEPLTRRELEVLHLIAMGDSNQMIAEKLVVTLSAVKKHTGNIFGKLNVNNRTQAVVLARKMGLLSQDS